MKNFSSLICAFFSHAELDHEAKAEGAYGTLTRMDAETGRRLRPSWLSVTIHKLKQPFTCRFWQHLFERTDNETLVDSKLLSYACIEAGIIETVSTSVLTIHLIS
jgi:hypothetical protein